MTILNHIPSLKHISQNHGIAPSAQSLTKDLKYLQVPRVPQLFFELCGAWGDLITPSLGELGLTPNSFVFVNRIE